MRIGFLFLLPLVGPLCALADFSDAFSAAELATSFWKKGKCHRALRIASKALEQWPNDFYLNLRKAQALADIGNPSQAMRSIQRAVALASSQKQRKIALGFQANIQLKMNKPKKALETIERALQIDPDDSWNLRVLGQVHLVLGNLKPAHEAAQESLLKGPRNSRSLLVLLEAEIRLRNFSAALETARQLQSGSPGALSRITSIVRKCLAKGDFECAGIGNWIALELEPENHYALVQKALILMETDSPEAAVPILDKVISENPHNPVAQRVRAKALEMLNPTSSDSGSDPESP